MAARTIAFWEQRRREAQSEIDAAYWAFTRQRRAKPPILVVPEAYTILAVAERELRELKRSAA